jgi:ferredoxin
VHRRLADRRVSRLVKSKSMLTEEIVDDARSEVLAREALRGSLACIRCGACRNTCPVFRRSAPCGEQAAVVHADHRRAAADGHTTCSWSPKIRTNRSAGGRAASAMPEFAIGWPQQVWASGSSTSTPCRSSRSTVARPTFG